MKVNVIPMAVYLEDKIHIAALYISLDNMPEI